MNKKYYITKDPDGLYTVHTPNGKFWCYTKEEAKHLLNKKRKK